MDPHTFVPKINLDAEREIAYQSPDHLMPWGAKSNNSRNRRFNQKLYALYPPTRTLKILDIGCSGGGFVRDCIDDGHLAVGLEGSDYSKRFQRAEWATIPNFLFTCDATARFALSLQTAEEQLEPLKFDVVTSWEFIEHIAEDDLEAVASNVKRHLESGGLWIMSVSPNEEIINGVKLHQTVQPRAWWIEKFSQLGLIHLEEFVKYFNTQFVRGPKQGAPHSFHLVLTTDPSQVPSIPAQRLITYLFDRWLMSYPQKMLARLIVGI